MRILILLLISFTSFGQEYYLKLSEMPGLVVTPQRPVTITLKKGTYTIPIYLMIEKVDTTRDMIATFSIVNVTPPPPETLLIEAEDVASIQNAEVDPAKTKVYHIRQGAIISYGTRYFNKAKKVTINYARGNTGNGILTFAFKLGNTVILTKEVQLPYTGGWSTWKEIAVDLPTTTGLMGDIQFTITSQMQGAADLNKYLFE